MNIPMESGELLEVHKDKKRQTIFIDWENHSVSVETEDV
jgi:hypothetical protein